MIQIKKPKYEHDNYCTCCRKPFDDSMEVSFSHKDYNDSVNITLCGKCRAELMEALCKANANSALDHIHNVVEELQKVCQNKRYGKADQLSGHTAHRQIVDHGFCHRIPFLCLCFSLLYHSFPEKETKEA